MVSGYTVAQLVHVLAASVWIGGHLVIALGYLPRLLRGELEELDRFERVYERIALPSLALAVATGIYLGAHWYPVTDWLGGGKASLLGVKAALVVVTVALAADARVRIIGGARKRGRRPNPVDLAAHVAAVTAIAVAFAVLGWALRFT